VVYREEIVTGAERLNIRYSIRDLKNAFETLLTVPSTAGIETALDNIDIVLTELEALVEDR
jgi:hypothetical protein